MEGSVSRARARTQNWCCCCSVYAVGWSAHALLKHVGPRWSSCCCCSSCCCVLARLLLLFVEVVLCLFVLCLFVCLFFCWLFVCLFVSFFAPCFFDLCLFVCLFVCLHSFLECFCCCSVILVLVLVVFLVVFIDVSTPRSRMLTPPLPHAPRPRSRIYRRFVTSHRPPAGTPSLLKKDYRNAPTFRSVLGVPGIDCKTHHFPPPRRQTREDSSLRPRGTVPELPSGTKGCKTSICPALITSRFWVLRPLC